MGPLGSIYFTQRVTTANERAYEGLPALLWAAPVYDKKLYDTHEKYANIFENGLCE